MAISADDVYSWANWLLLAALVLGALATWAIVVSGNVKETNLKRQLAQAEEHAATANERAAQANQRAAQLESEAETARLETEQIKKEAAWRTLSEGQRNTIANMLKKHSMEITIAWTPLCQYE